MGNENPIRTLGDYSRPSHEGCQKTIELLDRNNAAPLRLPSGWCKTDANSTDLGYMAAHTERIERFEKAILKQREEINDGMVEMFGILKDLTTSMTLEKVLVREEARHPITRHVNTISLVKMEKEKSVENNEVTDKNVVEPSALDVVEPIELVDRNEGM
nr:hypothetical protein [Tanacetum cinerariifolium]